MVPLLELPDALAGVAGVARDGDRPEGVGGLHDVGPLGPGTVGRPGDHPDGERREDEHDEQLDEHVFVILGRTRVRVKPVARAMRPAARSPDMPRGAVWLPEAGAYPRELRLVLAAGLVLLRRLAL